MIAKTYIITNKNEIYKGLAFEQVLYLYSIELSKISLNIEQNLCVWRSMPAVVVGRNQNHLLECNYPYLSKLGIDFARRDSGGGTVYQDEQNLNFCFIQKTGIDTHQNLQFLCTILASLGFNCEIDNKHNILYQGKKISGSAFRHSGGVQMHHFTLLLDTDLEKLTHSLQPQHGLTIESAGIDSNRTQVTNLHISLEKIYKKIEESELTQEVLYYSQEDMEQHSAELFSRELARLKNHEWLFERMPNCSLILDASNFKLSNTLLNTKTHEKKKFRITFKRGKIVKIEEFVHNLEMQKYQIIFEGNQTFFVNNSHQEEPHKIQGSDIILDIIIDTLYQKIFGG